MAKRKKKAKTTFKNVQDATFRDLRTRPTNCTVTNKKTLLTSTFYCGGIFVKDGGIRRSDAVSGGTFYVFSSPKTCKLDNLNFLTCKKG